MGSKSFSFGEVLGFGWRVMAANIWFFVGVGVVLLLISLLGQIPGQIMAHYPEVIAPFWFFVLLGVTFIIEIILGIGLIKISLSFCDGQKPRFSTLFNGLDCFWRYLGAGLLYGLIIGGAFTACALPIVLLSTVIRAPCFAFLVSVAFSFLVVILAIKFSLCFYFVIDKGLDPINALRASSRATKGAKWLLFVLFILCGLINLLGVLCFFVGVFATFPTIMIAMALVYRQLSEQTPELAELGTGGTGVKPHSSTDAADVAGMQFGHIIQSVVSARPDQSIQSKEAIRPAGGTQPKMEKKSNSSLLFWLVVLVILGVVLAAGIGYRFWPKSKGAMGAMGGAIDTAIFNRPGLTGILYSEDNPSAVIDGKIVKEGDIINGVKVVKIHRDAVEFEKDGKKWTQQLQ